MAFGLWARDVIGPKAKGGDQYDVVIRVIDYDHATLEKGNYADLYEKANNREAINGVLLWERDDDDETIIKMTDKYVLASSYLVTTVTQSPVYFSFAMYDVITGWYVAPDNSVGTTD